VRNQTTEALEVFLDECSGHRRLGTVASEGARPFRLPSSVYLQGSQLIVHAFTTESPRYVSSARHTPGPDTVRLADAEGPGFDVQLGPATVRVEEGSSGPEVLLDDARAQATLRVRCERGELALALRGPPPDRAPYDAVLVFAPWGLYTTVVFATSAFDEATARLACLSAGR